MAAVVSLVAPPVLQFFNNLGVPNAGGSLLTQVGGINTATYQDSAGTIPLPNPIPLNSRGEVSNAAGISSQLFLIQGSIYTFILYDAAGNQIDTFTYAVGISTGLATQSSFTPAGTGAVTTTVAAKLAQEMSCFDFMTAAQIASVQANTFVTDVTAPLIAAISAASVLGIARLRIPSGGYLVSATLNRPADVYLIGDGPEFTTIKAAPTFNGNIIATIGNSVAVVNRGGVQNLCVFGSWGANHANTLSVGIFEQWTNRSIYKDLRIHGCYRGMYGQALWQVIWDNISVDGLGSFQSDTGFYLDQLLLTFPVGTSNAVQAVNCISQQTNTMGFNMLNPNGSKFVSCEAQGGNVGFSIGNTAAGCYPIEFLTMSNCLADTNASNGFQFLQGSNASPVMYMQLSNCWASSHGQTGFYLNGCQWINLTNSQSENNNLGAVLLSQSSQCSVTGGIYQGNNLTSNVGIGDIQISGGSYNLIANNFSNMANGVSVSFLESNATNNNNVVGNTFFQGATFIGAASRSISNFGYNPVGITPQTVGASPATITAAQSPETHYLKQSATNTATVAKGGNTLGTLTAGTTLVVQLDPGGSYVVTWATTAPTYIKDIH